MLITSYQVVGIYGENCPDACWGRATAERKEAEKRLAAALAYREQRKAACLGSNYTGASWSIVETTKVVKDTEGEE